jgi:threonine dehydrogenase-like Zn-dependent dehydrogenase
VASAGPAGARLADARPAFPVRALVFRHSLAREAASAIGGRVDSRAFVSRFAPARIEDVDELPLPAPDWVRVQTTFSGLCGSDVKQILLNGSRDNPLTALVSFPHVLGHEVVGRRMDTGERVVLNPWLSCGPRGIDPPCSACLSGRYPWCRNFRSGNLPVTHRTGAAPLVPWSRRDWLQDGPAVVYDTIGSVETVETSLRLLATGGTLVVSGVEPPRGRFERVRHRGGRRGGQARHGALLRFCRRRARPDAGHHAPVPARALGRGGAGM